jgi:hypothetical protein
MEQSVMVSIQRFRVGLVVLLFLSWAGTPLVWADDTESPWKAFTLKAGGYFPIQDSGLQVTGKGGLGLGTKIDLEDRLNLEKELSTFRIDAEWRFFPRHRINFSYFDLSREAITAISSSITIGDQIFVVNDIVDTRFDWETFAASYTWSFLQTNKYEVGATIGAHITTLKLGIASLALNLGQVETKSATIPLPVLGLTGAYAFTPKLVLRSDVGVFALKVGEVEGSQVNFNLDLEYNAWKYVGFGIGYNFYRLDVDIDKDDAFWETKYQYHGFKAFIKFYL